MSKEYYKSDGSRVVVTDNNDVYDSNGLKGHINTFGNFVSANGSEGYTVYGDGSFAGTNGTSGSITNGNHIQMNNTNSGNGGSSLRTPSTIIRIPLWIKLLFVFGVIPVLGGISLFKIVSYVIFIEVYEKFQSGNVVPIIVFFVVQLILVILFILLIRKVIKLIKKKIK